MKFDVTAIPDEAIADRVQVGDVLPAKGGRGDTALWLVVAVRGNSVHMLGLSRLGEIVSTASYGMHALSDRAVIGRCNELADFVASIQCGARP
jgi:hypothetical protein